jgi:hypothetical protein
MPTPLEQAKMRAWEAQHDTVITWLGLRYTNPEMPLLAAVRLAKQLVQSSEEFDARISKIGQRHLCVPALVPVCCYCGKVTCSLARNFPPIMALEI